MVIAKHMIVLGLALLVLLLCSQCSRAGPIGPMTNQQNEYYMTRGWGEASPLFSVAYSNYGRAKLQQKPSKPPPTLAATIKPRPATRKAQPKSVKKDYGMSQLFMSRGWGPSGK